MHVSRRAVLSFGVAAAASAGCSRFRRPPPIQWVRSIDEAYALTHHAPLARRLVFVMIGASWDKASAEYEEHTFKDPAVRALLNDDYIAVWIDVSDDESSKARHAQLRFKVVGTPTIIVYAPQFAEELLRVNEYLPATDLLQKLRPLG